MDYPLIPSHDTNGLCTTATTKGRSFFFSTYLFKRAKSTAHGYPQNVTFNFFSCLLSFANGTL